MKNKSLALIGVPSQFKHIAFNEYIGFNAGRIYGSIQLSHLFANWKQGTKYISFDNNYILYIYINRRADISAMAKRYYLFTIIVYTEAIDEYEIDASKNNVIVSAIEERLDSYGYQPIYILKNEKI